MKLHILQENLEAGLRIAARAVSRRSLLPVLTNVLLEGRSGQLRLVATDLEMMIVCPVGARIEEEGAITIQAEVLLQLVKGLPPEVIDLEVKDNALHLQCGRFEAHLKGISAEEFPVVSAFPSEAQEVEMNAQLLCQMVHRVAFAAGDDVSRPVLSGVLLTFQRVEGAEGPGPNTGEWELTMAATDGIRLSACHYPASPSVLSEGSLQHATGVEDTLQEARSVSLIVPSRALTEVARLCAKSEEPVTIAVGGEGNRVFFQHQGVRLASQLIEGHFPDFRKIIPTSWKTYVNINRGALLQATRMAGIFADGESKAVKLSFSPKDAEGPGLVTVAGSGDIGSHVGELEAAVEGEKLSIAFSSPYLMEPLSHLDSDRLVLEATSPTRPMVMRPLDDDVDGDYIHIVMPVQVKEEETAKG